MINKDKSIIDLRGANLHGADLSNADLHGANLSEADLIRANLSGSNLRDANLSGADGGYSSIFANIIIDLSGVNRDENYLDGVNLSEADLSGATLYKMTIDHVLLDEANSLKGAIMPDGSKHS